MSNEGLPEAGPNEETYRFAGAREFQTALRATLAQAASDGWLELLICDPDFADWPLGERHVIDTLNTWAGSGRRLVMLAGRYDEVSRRHARFVVWRRHWSHIIECYRHTGNDPRLTPSAMWSRRRMLHRYDMDGGAGLVTSEPARCQRLKQQLDECLAVSVPAFAASTLGL